MTGTLGDFGTPRPLVEESFGWFGAQIRVRPNLSDLAIIETFRAVQEMTDANAVEAPRMVASSFVHSDDVDEFMRRAVDNGQSLNEVIDVAMRVIAALTDRPTRLPSGSSDGQSTTVKSSAAASSSRALRVLDGRPDLQLMVLQSEEARRAG